MRLWRIALDRHPPFNGGGGLLYSGRWHSKGRRIVYCSFSVGDAMLETIAHFDLDAEDTPDGYTLFAADVPDDIGTEEVDHLAVGWQDDLSLTQRIGDSWLEGRTSPALRVPSALAPYSYNLILNPEHSACPDLVPVVRDMLVFDPRVLRIHYKPKV